MTPIESFVSVKGETGREIALAKLSETKRRKKILSFPEGEGVFCVSPGTDRIECKFGSLGGIIVPFEIFNPFYLIPPHNTSEINFPGTKEVLVELGVEGLSYTNGELELSILSWPILLEVYDKGSVERGQQIPLELQLAVSSLSFLNKEKLEAALKNGLVIGEYCSEIGDNVINPCVLCLPHQKDKVTKFAVVPLRKSLFDRNLSLRGNMVPPFSQEILDSAFAEKPKFVCTCWKEVNR